MIDTRWITAEEFAADSIYLKGWYLLRGEVKYDMGNAHSVHETVKAIVHEFFIDLLSAARIEGRVFSDTSYQFDALTVMAPDVSVQMPARKPVTKAYFQQSPEVAVEILSPCNSPEEIDEKAKVYVTHGAATVLVLDPAQKATFVIAADGEWQPTTAIWLAGRMFELDFWKTFEED